MARKLIAGLIALALAIVIVAPVVLGWQAERTYARIVDRVNADSPDLAVRIDEYERGWLSAHARYTVTITGPYRDAFREITGTDRRLELHGRDRISHGPWAGGRPAIARIDSEVRMPEALRALGQDAIADDPVLSARSFIDLGGDVRSRFRVPDHRIEAAAASPEGESGDLAIEWRDVAGGAGVLDGTAHVSVDVREFTLQNDGGDRLAVSGLGIDDRSRRSDEGIRLGRTGLTIRRLDLQVGHTERPLDLRMQRLTATNETGVDGDHAEIAALLTFEHALVNGMELTDAGLETRLRHLRRAPLARMQALLAGMQRDLDAGEDLEASDVPDTEIRAALDDLLRGSPQLQSERLQVHTPDGRVSGDLRLAFDGERGFDVDRPPTLLGPLSGRMELHIPRTLVRRGLHAGMRAQLGGGERGEETDARLQRQAEQTIELLVGARLLDEDGDQLIVRLEKDPGGPPLLNGQDIMQLVRAISGLMER